ncbi:MAG: radical SAM protein, partial [Promethearchaeota archaeon]
MLENSFYIETYGCTSNKADSYIIAETLLKSHYVQTTQENAQFIIINTCGVKEQTENKIKTRLKELDELYRNIPNKYIIIAGCLPYIAPNYLEIIKKVIPSFSAIIDLDNIIELPEFFKEIKNGKHNLVFKSEKLIDKAGINIDHPPGKITGIIPISEGCLGKCTYCCVKNARGKLNCYNPKNIIQNVKYQLKQGIKQIYLTSQDCSIYKFNETTLYDLINKINSLEFSFFLRIGMINPNFLINNTEQLISIFKLPKVYQFLHVPIQSGSNNILKKMQRNYLISDIIDNLEHLRI